MDFSIDKNFNPSFSAKIINQEKLGAKGRAVADYILSSPKIKELEDSGLSFNFIAGNRNRLECEVVTDSNTLYARVDKRLGLFFGKNSVSKKAESYMSLIQKRCWETWESLWG